MGVCRSRVREKRTPAFTAPTLSEAKPNGVSPVSLKTNKYGCNLKRSVSYTTVFDVVHIVLGVRQFVPTGRLLVMAPHRDDVHRDHPASIAQTPEITTQKGH